MTAAAILVLLNILSQLFSGDGADIVFVGDAMMHQAQIDDARRRSPDQRQHSFSECFTAIKPYITQADYAVVNLEVPLGGRPYTGYPCFSAPDSYAEALADAGFDLFLTANNHTLDRQHRGLIRTLNVLDSLHLDHIGTYRHIAERDSVIPFISDVKGFKIAFLNYTYGTNGIEPSGNVVVDYIDRTRIAADIDSARRRGAELVAVAIHWGDEYKLLPNASQKSLADYLVDHGADLIIGGHPHVIQPFEMRNNAEGRNVLLVYSLGNFISNMKTRDTRGGAMIKVHLDRDAEGRACVSSATYRLVFTVPPTDTTGFRLVAVEKCDSRQWQEHCKNFTKSAESIFNNYNQGVSRDTSLIENKKTISLEKILHKTFGIYQK